MALVHDGYIIGETVSPQRRCPICGETTLCIKIVDVNFPAGVTARATILLDKANSTPSHTKQKDDGAVMYEFIGIGCGDYAKFHRQLCHIRRAH